MTQEREVLRMALEALENIVNSLATHDDEGMIEHAQPMIDARESIATIKEVLAQPQQEPVAWWNPTKDSVSTDPVHRHNKDCQPLYTSPPAQRKPLTTQEIREWWASENGLEDYKMSRLHDFEQVVRAIEAAHGIKEKNT